MSTKVRFHANPQGGGMAVVTDFWYEWDDNRPDAEQRAEDKARELNELMEKLEAVAEAAKEFTCVSQLEPWDEEAEDAYQAICKALAELEQK